METIINILGYTGECLMALLFITGIWKGCTLTFGRRNEMNFSFRIFINPLRKHFFTTHYKKYNDRAIVDDLNCRGAMEQLLYSLSEQGLLKEPYASYVHGHDDALTEEQKNIYNTALTENAGCILLFIDEVEEHGEVLAEKSKQKQ